MPRLSFAHIVLWHGDAWYRRAWYIAPQLLAIASAGWILMVSSAPPAPGPASGPGSNPAPWAAPESAAQMGIAADMLRNRAETDQAAFDDLKAQADAGNGYMQFALGTLYDPNFKLSKLFSPDMPTAMRYYRLAADQGDVVAESNFGYYTATGNSGVPRDPATGFSWVLKAANSNYALAKRQAGVMYRDGIGVAADRTSALSWFQKAADGDDHYSQAEIGAAYWNGTPPYRKDPAEAVKWYLKAVTDPEQVNSVRMLGIAYRDGQGCDSRSCDFSAMVPSGRRERRPVRGG
jgi:TPR repeat protein